MLYKDLKLMLNYNMLLDITIDYTNIIINICVETIIIFVWSFEIYYYIMVLGVHILP